MKDFLRSLVTPIALTVAIMTPFVVAVDRAEASTSYPTARTSAFCSRGLQYQRVELRGFAGQPGIVTARFAYSALIVADDTSVVVKIGDGRDRIFYGLTVQVPRTGRWIVKDGVADRCKHTPAWWDHHAPRTR